MMQEYATKCESGSKAKHGVSYNNNKRITWEDVLIEVEKARESWENKAKGKKGLFRKRARDGCDKARLANPWLELLPGGDYGSTVLGGLKLIFGVRNFPISIWSI